MAIVRWTAAEDASNSRDAYNSTSISRDANSMQRCQKEYGSQQLMSFRGISGISYQYGKKI
jgi:hypothetical protein